MKRRTFLKGTAGFFASLAIFVNRAINKIVSGLLEVNGKITPKRYRGSNGVLRIGSNEFHVEGWEAQVEQEASSR